MLRKITVLLFSLGLCACVSTRYDVDEIVTMKDVMKVKVVKLHDKARKGRFDVSVEISNLNPQSIVFYYGEIRCFRDGRQGRLDYPFFGAGERAIDLKPHETKYFNYTCKTKRGEELGHEFKLVYGRVFANPNNDGLTSGKLLAKELGIAIQVSDAE